MPPNPEFHNGKRPEDNSFVNIAFSAEDSTATAHPIATIDATPTTPTESSPNSVLTRRNSAGNSKSEKDNNQKLVKSTGSAGDSNNNNNGDKAMIACGSSVATAGQDSLMDFDDLLPHIGEFGRYQKILFLLMIPFAFFVAWTYFSQIFLTLVPQEYHCALPELDALLLSAEDR